MPRRIFCTSALKYPYHVETSLRLNHTLKLSSPSNRKSPQTKNISKKSQLKFQLSCAKEQNAASAPALARRSEFHRVLTRKKVSECFGRFTITVQGIMNGCTSKACRCLRPCRGVIKCSDTGLLCFFMDHKKRKITNKVSCRTIRMQAPKTRPEEHPGNPRLSELFPKP